MAALADCRLGEIGPKAAISEDWQRRVFNRFSIISMVDGSGAGLETSCWAAMFDLSLAGAGDRYTGSANLVDVARYGQFTNPELPWERVTFDQTVVDPAGSK